MDLADTPASTIAREDAVLVEIRRDVLDAHRAACAAALQGEAIDQPNRVGVQQIDLQLLFGFRAALLGRDDAIADRRQ